MLDDDPILEEDYSFQCPYCGADVYVRLEASGGKKQQFCQDCEVCCRPITIRAEFDSDGQISHFATEQES
jgi:hypothetical protein